MQISRALLMMLAGTSLFVILFGSLDVSAVAADTRWPSSTSAPGDGSNIAGDANRHCDPRSGGEPGPRPPVLAPPALTIPASSPINEHAQAPGAVDTIAISTVLLAATMGVAALLLIRRSG